MRHYTLNLTTACQNNCLFCDFKYPPLKNAKFYKINYSALLKNKAIKNCIVSLGGGEPTLNKKLIAIVKDLKSKGNYVELISNGQKLADVNYLRNLITAGIDRFCISLHNINPTQHDLLTRKKGSFAKTWQGILNLIKLRGHYKYDLNIVYVLNTKNLVALVKTLKIFNRLAKINFQINLVHTNKKELLIDLNKIKKEFSRISPERLRNLTIHLYGFAACFLPQKWQQHVVDYNNNDKTLTIGKEKFSHKKLIKLAKIKFSICKECRLDKKCLGIWRVYQDFAKINDLEPVL
jgi:MoaA/NifB/PqqE/SkfB family radical SAM enzyme